jgi:hypothetical protein
MADLCFDSVVAHVPGDANYLCDDFYDGYCCLEIPREAHKIFAKYHVNKLTDAANGEIMSVLRKLFVGGDASAFGKQMADRKAIIEQGSIRVNVKNDAAIQDLFADEEFIKLNKEFCKNKKQANTTVQKENKIPTSGQAKKSLKIRKS